MTVIKELLSIKKITNLLKWILSTDLNSVFFLARIPNFGTLLTKIYHLLAPKSDLNSLSLEMNLLNT